MQAANPQDAQPQLRGDLTIWLVILAELATFGLLFVGYAFARLRDPALFNASQASLHLHSGALNTVLLICGSGCVAMAVQALRRDARAAGSRWLLAALLCGLGFMVVKSLEFGEQFAAGVNLSTNTFFMFYLMLAGFHYLHVAAGLLFIALVWWKARQGAYGPDDCHAPETAAAFWHMVDLLWIVLFPLVYLMR